MQFNSRNNVCASIWSNPVTLEVTKNYAVWRQTNFEIAQVHLASNPSNRNDVRGGSPCQAIHSQCPFIGILQRCVADVLPTFEGKAPKGGGGSLRSWSGVEQHWNCVANCRARWIVDALSLSHPRTFCQKAQWTWMPVFFALYSINVFRLLFADDHIPVFLGLAKYSLGGLFCKAW